MPPLTTDKGSLLRLISPAVLGALLGALVPVNSSERAFVAAIPFLLAISVAAILFGPQLHRLMMQRVPSGGRC